VLDWGARTYVMGILNVTPDSFSGDGILEPDLAVQRGLWLIEAGADILDVGGESTRPGSQPVGLDEERRRVVPIIQGIRQASNAPISVDTSHAAVAEAALHAGADIINDVKGFRGDAELAGVAARHGALVVAMHNRVGTAVSAGAIGTYFGKAEYHDLMGEIAAELRESEAILTNAGVAEDRIILDPGIGFGKTPQHNLELMRRLGELRALGRPLLIGPSRKSFIGLTLDLPPEERLEGTAAVVALGIQQGADIVRVHDLPAMKRVARMADAIVRGRTQI
jgi:dihydropteroate synthase